MPIKTFVAGEILTATDVMRYFEQRVHAVKSADETINNSSVLQDDDHLFATVLANTTYWVELNMRASGGTTEDLKFRFTRPADASFWWGVDSSETDCAPIGGFQVTAKRIMGITDNSFDSEVIPGMANGTITMIRTCGILVTSSTGGTFRLRWSQNTAGSGTSTILKQSSSLFLIRLGA